MAPLDEFSLDQRDALLAIFRCAAEGEELVEHARRRLCSIPDFDPYEAFGRLQGSWRSQKGWITAFDVKDWLLGQAKTSISQGAATTDAVISALEPYENRDGEVRYDAFLQLILPRGADATALKEDILVRGARSSRFSETMRGVGVGASARGEVDLRLADFFGCELDLLRRLKRLGQSLVVAHVSRDSLHRLLGCRPSEWGNCTFTPVALRACLEYELKCLTPAQCGALLRRLNPSGRAFVEYVDFVRMLGLPASLRGGPDLAFPVRGGLAGGAPWASLAFGGLRRGGSPTARQQSLSPSAARPLPAALPLSGRRAPSAERAASPGDWRRRLLTERGYDAWETLRRRPCSPPPALRLREPAGPDAPDTPKMLRSPSGGASATASTMASSPALGASAVSGASAAGGSPASAPSFALARAAQSAAPEGSRYVLLDLSGLEQETFMEAVRAGSPLYARFWDHFGRPLRGPGSSAAPDTPTSAGRRGRSRSVEFREPPAEEVREAASAASPAPALPIVGRAAREAAQEPDPGSRGLAAVAKSSVSSGPSSSIAAAARAARDAVVAEGMDFSRDDQRGLPTAGHGYEQHKRMVLRTMARQGRLDVQVEDAKAILPPACTPEAVFAALDRHRKGYVSETDLFLLVRDFGATAPFSSVCALVREAQLRNPSELHMVPGHLSMRNVACLLLPAASPEEQAASSALTDQELRTSLRLLRLSEPCPECGLRVQKEGDGMERPVLMCPSCRVTFACRRPGIDPFSATWPLSSSEKYQLHRLLVALADISEEMDMDRQILASEPTACDLDALGHVFRDLTGGHSRTDAQRLCWALDEAGLKPNRRELELMLRRYVPAAARPGGMHGLNFSEFARQLRPHSSPR